MAAKAQKVKKARKNTAKADVVASRCGLTPKELAHMLRDAGLLILCAEPGCIYTGLAEDVLRGAGAPPSFSFYRNFSKTTISAAVEAVGRLSREVSKRARNAAEEIVVALDFVPPADEYEVARLAIAIDKMRRYNALVLITVLPEARQLAEGLDGYLMLRTDDLCERSLACRTEEPGSTFDETWRLTRGIPALLRPLRAFYEWRTENELPIAYDEALRDVVELGLRPSLHEDELKLRLGATLLGSGSLDDLAEVMGGVDREILDDLALWAPLYGIDLSLGRFDCVTDYSNGWLAQSLPLLTALVEKHDDLALSCARILGESGDIERLASIIPILPKAARVRAVLRSGPELIDGGYLFLVSKVLGLLEETGLSRETGAPALKRVVRAMSQSRLADTYFHVQASGQAPLDQGVLLCGSLLRMRSLLRGAPARAGHMAVTGSSLGKRLRLHEEALTLLEQGKFRETIEMLVPISKNLELETVSECVLALDLEIARALCCDAKWGGRKTLDSCKAFLVTRGYDGLNGYLWLAEAIVEGLAGAAAAKISAIESAAMRAGEPMARAIAQLAGAILGLRRGASAYVLAAATAAESSCRELGLVYAMKVAGLIKSVTRFSLGEQPRFYEIDGKDGLAMLGKITHDAMSESGDDLVPAEDVEAEIPVNELWLLMLLSDGESEFSEALADQVPTGWRRGIEVARRRCMRSPTLPRAAGVGRAAAPERREVRINLLGEFAVWAGGKRVPDWMLESRNAKNLLEYLVLQANHLAGRPRLAELVWPDVEDGVRANQRLYQSTSAARKALKLVGYEEELFINNKATKVVQLAPDLVRCDVDEFVASAKAVLNSASDSKACEHALKAEALYTGDLCVFPTDESPFLLTRRAELRRLYADAMVAGGEAALRLGKKRHAYRFANNAMLIDDLREDAAILLISSLRASGRDSEATNRYRMYAEKLAKKLGKLPSDQVQEAMRRPIGDEPDDGSVPQRAQRFA